jgi:pimeloyl-ACP methyl ester carboxylesterase
MNALLSTSPGADLPIVHCRCAIVDGLKVFYREAGLPTSPVVVLLHGFPSSSHMYRDLIPLLADRYRVIAPDYIGFGYSDAPSADQFDYTFDNLAQKTRFLLDQLGVSRAIFYMQDYGGPIGMRLATAQPSRVQGLIFQNANAYMEGVSQATIDVFMPLWQDGDETGARQMLLAETTRYQYTAGARDPGTLCPDAWTHDQALLDRPGNDERQLALFKNYQTNVASYDDWHAYFRQHQPKALVAWGKGDPFFTVAGAQAFKTDLKNVEVHLFDTGHFALEEDARPIADLIKRYFSAS